MTSQPDWRAVFALLANDQTSYALAHVILSARTGAPLPADLDKRALPRLAKASIIAETDTGWRLNVDGLAERLEQEGGASSQHDGVARFVRDGRIVNYPASHDDREQLLTWVAQQVLEPAETVDERTLNERIAPFMEEFALLRRFLVDYGAVERTNDGSSYWLPGAVSES